jgi:hypothetical protein
LGDSRCRFILGFQAAFKDKIIGSLKTEKPHFRLPHPPPQGSLKPALQFPV